MSETQRVISQAINNEYGLGIYGRVDILQDLIHIIRTIYNISPNGMGEIYKHAIDIERILSWMKGNVSNCGDSKLCQEFIQNLPENKGIQVESYAAQASESLVLRTESYISEWLR